MSKARVAMAFALAFALAGCSWFQSDVEPPPRSDTPIETSQDASTFAANVDIRLAALRSALEAEIPRQLWAIDQQDVECVASRRTKVIGIAIKSPTIRCDLAGAVTRGRLRLSGAGQDLLVTMPIEAKVTASDIGGVIRQKTGTAQATVTARVRPRIGQDWRITGDVAISYDWKQPPTVSLLGREITFANQADERLNTVVRTLERVLEREISRLNVRQQIEPLWERSFAVLSLNQENPPVWLRVTPQNFGFDGYTASRKALSLKVRLNAQTEIFVGEQPEPNKPIALPDIQPAITSEDGSPQNAGLNLTLPVVAQYAELEPVLLRALNQRAEQPFILPQLGERMIEIGSVTVYGTQGNRVAVGVEFEAWKPGERDDPASGTVWLTALPQNDSDSRIVEFIQPEYQAETSRFTTNVLLEIAKTQDFSDVIEGALTQNFEGDYSDLLSKVQTALNQQRLGNFVVNTRLDTVSTGTIKAYGEGLHLPVSANGTAQIRYAPQ
ncbi:MAG: DUF4403 family protein [Erythrobacter sp.]